MSDLRASSLMPFIPCGKDYAVSRRPFADLGFEELWESGAMRATRTGKPSSFFRTSGTMPSLRT